MGEDLYRYRYGPLLLAALEQEIETEKMKRFVKYILQTPVEKQKSADYNFLRLAAFQVGVTSAEWNQFERKYVTPDPAKSKFGEMLITLNKEMKK